MRGTESLQQCQQRGAIYTGILLIMRIKNEGQ